MAPAEDPAGDAIEANPQRCGCNGKPPLDRVVLPAVRDVQDKLDGSPVTVATHEDVGYLPATDRIERTVETSRPGDDPDSVSSDPDAPGCSGEMYSLAATLLDGRTGSSVDRFSEYLYRTYQRSIPGGNGVIPKGHTVLVDGISEPVQVFEHLRPSGQRLPGQRVANVDVIHALPEQPVETQARVAAYNALNDCYSAGGYRERTVRPILAHSSGDAIGTGECRRWFRRALPADITLLEPCIVTHDGTGWLFGATVTARITHDPPRFVQELGPGDRILVHRPLGALARYTNALVSDGLDGGRTRTVDPMTRDHVAVAREIAAFCPGPDEPFDGTSHLKLASDVSGPGIGGIHERIGRTDIDVELTDLPLVDPDVIARGQQEWLLPDVTRETNGPLAVVGTEEVIDEFERSVSDIPAADPAVVGRIVEGDGNVTADDSVEIQHFIETFEGSDGQ